MSLFVYPLNQAGSYQSLVHWCLEALNQLVTALAFPTGAKPVFSLFQIIQLDQSSAKLIWSS